ncbi:branched-chain alpha-keto acid dehydrogenase subunit E2 [filamentous cyanobacterium CCT1]|nr:branched-chain alpha-keto acid dehydrogenase subunit E2 [filamentous cyanobacterium CCT1]PSN78140.1 branched-chain alpha-keto acid dehydrogenase subunit E2 [filamentous cyanobacterium CCP4]
MIREVFMPALSSTMTEGKIVSWVKSPGDRVEKGETVVIVESDKADMDVESFHEGILAAIVVEAGGTAPVGEAIALLAETEAEVDAAKQQAAAKAGANGGEAAPAPAAPVAVVEAPAPAQNGASSGSPSGRVVISPRARKLAKDLKVDLTTLQGSGPHGRIVAQDVELAAGKTPTTSGPVATPMAAAAPPVAAPVPAPPPAAPVPSAAPLGQVVPFNTLQQAVTRNMVASLAVPTFHVGYTITTDNLDSLYKQIKSKGVTMTGLLAKAVAVTLQKHPLVNAGYTDQGIQYRSGINIAVAVAMEGGGLITPVLKNADQYDIYSLSRTWADLVARSRSKQLQPDEYNSGTFTLSNLGMFGVDRFDAILPPGQGSILAIGASRPTVVATADGLMGVKRQMQVNITCDHRVIYGADAAAFLKDLAHVIENNPQSLTL